jgi:hypothetical protein
MRRFVLLLLNSPFGCAEHRRTRLIQPARRRGARQDAEAFIVAAWMPRR